MKKQYSKILQEIENTHQDILAIKNDSSQIETVLVNFDIRIQNLKLKNISGEDQLINLKSDNQEFYSI
jgi:hypothetical protein